MTKYSTLYITNNGIGLEGLNPSFVLYKDIVTGLDVAPVPVIDDLGSGLYRIVDTGISFGKRRTGLIDAGNTINNQSERFIPYFGSFEEINTQVSTVLSAALDEPNQSFLFNIYLQNNGLTQLTDLASASIQLYDYQHNLILSSGSASATNGMFVIVESTISLNLVPNRPYYALATITLTTGESFTSTESLITLQ